MLLLEAIFKRCRERFELPMMNVLYTRYLPYLGLLMDAFLFVIVLFSGNSVPASAVAVFGYVVLAARAYLFLLGTIFKSKQFVPFPEGQTKNFSHFSRPFVAIR